jgi:hypothetical protein
VIVHGIRATDGVDSAHSVSTVDVSGDVDRSLHGVVVRWQRTKVVEVHGCVRGEAAQLWKVKLASTKP